MNEQALETVVVAGGCFWGLEDLLKKFNGVVDTEVGYTGGENENPTYRNHPGHAEAVQITYDPNQTSYQDILDYFFRIHNPTTLNQQGNDKGTSYRSAIFVEDDDQVGVAQKVIDMVNQSKKYDDPVVTSIEPLTTFWPAEEYHQDYLEKNPGGYTCHFVRFDEPLSETNN